MAVTTSMFVFEVVVSNVTSMVESRQLIIKSDFADIFSLELKDPKQLNIVMPEPLPLPSKPPGKKKGKKKPKPKKKGKKGKKGLIKLPPPEPAIQSGQSVLFTSSAEVLLQNMKKFPLELSLWSKEDHLVYIGGNKIPWDPKFIVFLQEICNCDLPGPVTVQDEYNIFEEETGKLMVKIGLQVKLTNLTDTVTSSFRTLSEDPGSRKYLYTGMNSKTTSFMCTMKTTDEDYERNIKKIPTNYVKENPNTKIVYANYKNAPSANLSSLSDAEYCCQGNADAPPDKMYKSPETCPDIDFIIDYVRKIIISCNDNMRMLTPRPTIKPRIKATDIDRLCYCKETSWPEGELAERFKQEVKSGPCPICIDSGKEKPGSLKTVFDIANLRGPCGRPDCRVARRLREYIAQIVNEDQKEIDLASIIGPCGSKNCTLAEKIVEFIRHEGTFSHSPHSQTVVGLTTQCDCLNTMQMALMEKKNVCEKTCEMGCEDSEGEDNCPFLKKHGEKNKQVQVYNVYYCMVQYDFEKDSSGSSSNEKTTNTSKQCPSTLPSSKNICSKSTCSSFAKKHRTEKKGDEMPDMICNDKQTFPPSPADGNIEIRMEDILNPCCVKSCDLAERVKTFIEDSIELQSQRRIDKDNPCYCDCECSFQFSRRTTYCPVCGGYECLGDDMRDQPSHVKPHPCPVYHRLYDKKYIKTPNIWPEKTVIPETSKPTSRKSKTSESLKAYKPKGSTGPVMQIKNQLAPEKKSDTKSSDEKTKSKKDKKKATKTESTDKTNPLTSANRKSKKSAFIYPSVPGYMGWNWKAEDIPGMKPRPKWKPGGCNKLLVRRYRALREGVDVIAKKKRALMQRKKKIEMRPTLVIKKLKGEYTVQMEVFKKYSKERLVHQFPYEEKPPVVYTIGKTEEEKRKIQRHKERKERRETRRKSRLLQSTFRDKCQEICVKAYNQAIGLLPLPNPNDPDCPCHTEPPPNYISPSPYSCSCSEDGDLSSSDTDGDDWIIEFTPPAARWDPKAKHAPHTMDNESQYTYLDYKVKLNDMAGNPVPRFFKGPDGKEQCSDLGGFWSPDKKVWLEINKDGWIGPDNRWVPTNFTGPDGMYYSSEETYIIDSKGQTYKIGIDGYIDQDGKWVSYPKKRNSGARLTATDSKSNKCKTTKINKVDVKAQTPAITQKPEKKVMTKSSGVNEAKLEPPKAKVNLPSSGKGKCPLVMNVAVKQDSTRFQMTSPLPPTKRNFVDPKKLLAYKEIMQGLQIYEDLQELQTQPKAPIKTNRASNTMRYTTSPYTTSLQFCRGNVSSPLSSIFRA